MRKVGQLEDGTLIYQLTKDEESRLKRREGVRKNRAQCTASLGSIMRDIECTYGLSEGSVRIFNLETNKPYRSDVRIGTIRRNADY